MEISWKSIESNWHRSATDWRQSWLQLTAIGLSKYWEKSTMGCGRGPSQQFFNSNTNHDSKIRTLCQTMRSRWHLTKRKYLFIPPHLYRPKQKQGERPPRHMGGAKLDHVSTVTPIISQDSSLLSDNATQLIPNQAEGLCHPSPSPITGAVESKYYPYPL